MGGDVGPQHKAPLVASNIVLMVEVFFFLSSFPSFSPVSDLSPLSPLSSSPWSRRRAVTGEEARPSRQLDPCQDVGLQSGRCVLFFLLVSVSLVLRLSAQFPASHTASGSIHTPTSRFLSPPLCLNAFDFTSPAHVHRC